MEPYELKELACIFKTTLKDPKYTLPEEVVVVPASSARKELSSLVAQLLSLDSKKTKLEFLFEGEFIRMPLKDLVAEKNLSPEKPLEIYYTLQMKKPTK